METAPFAGGNGVARYGEAVTQLGPFCGHNGTIMGFSTEAWYLPAEDAVVVVNVNRLDADDAQHVERPLRQAAWSRCFRTRLK